MTESLGIKETSSILKRARLKARKQLRLSKKTKSKDLKLKEEQKTNDD